MDIAGPITPASAKGNRYILNILDDYTGYSWVFPMKEKAESGKLIIELIKRLEKEFNTTILTLRSDRGGEFTSLKFEDELKSLRIRHKKMTPDTPQSNGATERLNRTLADKVRPSLLGAKLPETMWPDAYREACYTRNRSPSIRLNHMTPYEALYQAKPDISKLRIFGEKCFVKILDKDRAKLDPKAIEGKYVGIDDESKAWRIYVRNKKYPFGIIKILRDVVFLDTTDTSDIQNQDDFIEGVEDSGYNMNRNTTTTNNNNENQPEISNKKPIEEKKTGYMKKSNKKARSRSPSPIMTRSAAKRLRIETEMERNSALPNEANSNVKNREDDELGSELTDLPEDSTLEEDTSMNDVFTFEHAVYVTTGMEPQTYTEAVNSPDAD